MNIGKNMLGSYGDGFLADFENRGFPLSFLHPSWEDASVWREKARERFTELSGLSTRNSLGGKQSSEELYKRIDFRAESSWEYDGLDISLLSWQLPYGPRTKAYYLRPSGENRALPGILAFHDHGAFKYFGKEKITRVSDSVHPLMKEHQGLYYGDVAWANEIAKRGFAVLVPDAFLFGSRKVRASDLPALVVKRMMMAPTEKEELAPEDMETAYDSSQWDSPGMLEDGEEGQPDTESVLRYNAFASVHEDIIAKSLFCAGTTWPGVFLEDDLTALDIFSSLSGVDEKRIGCGGLSGGGLRTNYVAGLDDRIRCAVSAGFMSTWKDFLLHKSHTHTWMMYIPLLSRYMDYPDILSMRAPLPTMVLYTEEDPLYTLEEVEHAADTIGRVYEKAGVREHYRSLGYAGPHKFDLPMQKDAFAWFEQWLL